MTQAWYQVASMGFGYLSAGIIALIVLLALRRYAGDRALWRRVRRNLPQAGAAGTLVVLASNSRRLSPGQEIRVPYEGTLGSAIGCDVCMPKVHMRSAFFWVEGDEMHMVPLHRDGFQADDVPVEPGDEAVLRDGAVLRVGEMKLVFRLCDRSGARRREEQDGPYVTNARRSKAQQGRGDGVGAPGRGEVRREQKREMKREMRREKKREPRREEQATDQDDGRQAREAAAGRKRR